MFQTESHFVHTNIQDIPVEIVCGRSITPGVPSKAFCGRSGQLAQVDIDDEDGMPPSDGEGVVAVLSVPVPLPLLPPLSCSELWRWEIMACTVCAQYDYLIFPSSMFKS